MKLAFVAGGSTLQTFKIPKIHYDRIYNAPLPKNAKQSSNEMPPVGMRLFGMWTVLSAIVRVYAAYNMSNPVLYDITIWTFVLVTFHYYSELVWFGTIPWDINRHQIIPLTQAPSALLWMLWQREYYLSGA